MFRSSIALGSIGARSSGFQHTSQAGDYIPYFRRVKGHWHDKRKVKRFLEDSKEPSTRPPLPDPRKKKSLVKVDLAKIMSIEVGDRVRVLYGSDKGKEGVVARILVEKNQVVVDGINMKRSFWHPEPGPGKPSLLSVECPVHITNVCLLDPVTKRPTRVKCRYMMNGERVRISKMSGCAMPAPVPVKPSERLELWQKHIENKAATVKLAQGAMKEDVFGNKEHFRMLVQIMRSKRDMEKQHSDRELLDE
mmetsp:Transcript_45043/g.104345  ORF Transcript_45043/g.104345 Transcript_45043/m.104345 type:complete len:249 (+) Transcript_45043:50-796(+)